VGSWSFCLAELADWRNDIASDGMAANDGSPQLRRPPGSHQKADVPVHGIKGLIIDPGEPGPVVFRRFGEARRDAVIFRNDGLYGPMLGFTLPEMMRSSTSASQTSGSTPLSFAVLPSDASTAKVSPPRALPTNKEFFLVRELAREI